MKINIAREKGEFAKKVFVPCKSKEGLETAFNIMIREHKTKINDISKYEIGKSGAIVYLAPTLMVWGYVRICNNTRISRNAMRRKGFIETTPDNLESKNENEI